MASDGAVATVAGEEVPVPGTERFDPRTAPPVWPVIGDARLPDLLRQRGGVTTAEIVVRPNKGPADLSGTMGA